MEHTTRCCIVHTNLKTGGAERQLLQLLKHWPDPQWHFDLVLLEEQGGWFDELPANVTLHSLSRSRPTDLLRQIGWSIRILPRLRRVITTGNYDLIMTLLWMPTLATTLALPGIRPAPRLIWSVQSDLAQAFRLRSHGRLGLMLMRACAVRHIDHFVMISSGIRSRTQSLLTIGAARCSIIPNSIDLDRIHDMALTPAAIPSRRAPLRIVTVGRLHPQKGMDLLLDALAMVRNQGGNIECYILGDGEERQNLEQRAYTLGLDTVVRFAGTIANPYAWLRTADLFVLPSNWEPFGIALAEAMALGLPVIATATDGAKELIEPYVDGVVVPVGDAHALATAILNLSRSPAQRAVLGEQAQQKAQRFDAPLIAQKYHTKLAELLDNDIHRIPFEVPA